MFDLEAHDIAWDENAAHCQVITPATHRGRNWRIGVESEYETGGRLIFQREDGPLLTAISWDVRFRSTEISLHAVREPCPLRMAFADCWNNGKWGRTLFLNENMELRKLGEAARFRVVLSPRGHALWVVLRDVEPPAVEIDISQGYAQFFWSYQDAPDLLLGGASILGALLQAQWNDFDSDLSFARRLAHMSAKEQHEQVWSWKLGDLDEMKRVLRWAFLAHHTHWDTPDESSWGINLWHQTQHKNVLGVLFRPTPPELEESLRLALEWFAPQPRIEHTERHLSLKSFPLSDWNHIYIEECQPSAHERLEAALQWRDWLESTRADG